MAGSSLTPSEARQALHELFDALGVPRWIFGHDVRGRIIAQLVQVYRDRGAAWLQGAFDRTLEATAALSEKESL